MRQISDGNNSGFTTGPAIIVETLLTVRKLIKHFGLIPLKIHHNERGPK
jgi:hypothetical protein